MKPNRAPFRRPKHHRPKGTVYMAALPPGARHPKPVPRPAHPLSAHAGGVAPLRWVHRIVLVVCVILVGWVFLRALLSGWITGQANGEIEATSRLLGLTDELRGILKVVGALVLVDLALPLVTAAGASLLGRRIRWSCGMAGRIAALLAFFALKPAVAALTGLDFRDGMPSKVVEIDPATSDLFDSRSSAPLVGVVLDGDGSPHFYNLRQGVRPSDGAKIRPATTEDVAIWKARQLRLR